ncbi:MAG: hypothetical protein AABY49_02385 [Planctomycetota bacterium]
MKRKQSKKYNVVVGITSYNESDTIPHVTETVGEGLEEYFSDKKSIIVNVSKTSHFKPGYPHTMETFLSVFL